MAVIVLTHRIKLTCNLYRTVNYVKIKPQKTMAQLLFFLFHPTKIYIFCILSALYSTLNSTIKKIQLVPQKASLHTTMSTKKLESYGFWKAGM